MSIYKACDIRGRFSSELLVSHATRLGLALAKMCGRKPYIVGGDGRLSTPELKQSLIAALVSAGCEVIDVGIVPTPALYYARQHMGIFPAVMVTASHNPSGDNGFKISLQQMPVTPSDIIALADIMEKLTDAEVAAVASTSVTLPSSLVREIDIIPEYVAFARAQSRQLDGMRIVVDCANGVAGIVARDIWQSTGADVSYLYDTIDGRFPNHPPDPSHAKNLQMLCKTVINQHADIGIAYDGDADRVMFVDGFGRYLSGDRAIVLFAQRALASGPAPIVYDQKCSLIVADAIRAMHGQPIIERSGHTFIKTTFLKHNAPYAGEISGHHFFRLLQGDDGICASLYMANLLRDTGKSLAQLADEIKTYPITPDIRLPMDNQTAQRVLDDLERGLAADARLTRLDGLRAEFNDGWGIARMSVTESAITLRFEGKDNASLQRVIQRFEQNAPDLRGRLPVVADAKSV